MSGVRVLVVPARARSSSLATSSGRSGTPRPAFSRPGGRPRRRCSRRPGPALLLAVAQLVRAADQRSDDGGRTWNPVNKGFVCAGVPGTHRWYDGTPHPWEFGGVWHLEPSLTDPGTVYAGVEDAALFRTSDGAASWHELQGLREHGSGSRWQPGAGGSTWQPVNQVCCLTASHLRPPRSGTACTTWPCTRPGRRPCSCRSMRRDAQRRLGRPLVRGQREPRRRAARCDGRRHAARVWRLLSAPQREGSPARVSSVTSSVFAASGPLISAPQRAGGQQR